MKGYALGQAIARVGLLGVACSLLAYIGGMLSRPMFLGSLVGCIAAGVWLDGGEIFWPQWATIALPQWSQSPSGTPTKNTDDESSGYATTSPADPLQEKRDKLKLDTLINSNAPANATTSPPDSLQEERDKLKLDKLKLDTLINSNAPAQTVTIRNPRNRCTEETFQLTTVPEKGAKMSQRQICVFASADVAIDACTALIQSRQSTGSDFAYLYVERGNAYCAKGDLDDAIADYSEASRLEPDIDEALSGRGNAYYANGEYDRAIATYDQLHDNTASRSLFDEIALNGLGNSYYMKGEYERARVYYDQVLRFDPHNSIALAGRQRIAAGIHPRVPP